jgi:integrase
MDIAEAHGHKKTGTKSELVLEGNAYDQFINAIKTKPTRKLYDIGLKKFMTFKHIDKVSDLLSWDPRIIEANVSAWIVDLKNRNLSSATIKGYLASVLFFYSMNDIEPRRNKIKRYLPEESRVNEDRAYTHQEIAKLIEFCDYRTKALVLLLASSGMRIGAVPELKIKHLTKID